MPVSRTSLLVVLLCFVVAVHATADKEVFPKLPHKKSIFSSEDEEELPKPIREMTIFGLDKSVPHMPLTYGHVFKEFFNALMLPLYYSWGPEYMEPWLHQINEDKRQYYADAFNKYQRELRQFYSTPRGRKMLAEIRRTRGE